MVTAVLTIGVLNLALGFALAILLEQSAAVSWLRLPYPSQRRQRAKRSLAPAETQPEKPTESAPDSVVPPVLESPSATACPQSTGERPAEPVWDGLPSLWIARLQSENLAPQSFAEGALWFIHRSVPECRRQLTTIMDRVSDSPNSTLPSDDIQEPSTAWLNQASGWASTLQTARPEGQESALCDELSHVLEKQLIKIRPAVTKCQKIAAKNALLDGKSMLEPLRELIETTDAVREQVQEILCRTLQQEKRLHEIPAGLELDEKTQAFNRLGLAKVGAEWIENDPTRLRLVCGVLVDVDNFSDINAQLGQCAADALVDSLGSLLKSLIRKERGFDRIARISGQRYLLFFGDTALRNAMYGAERIRSNVQATTFKVSDANIRLTVSCAVSEWAEQELLEEWLYRLQLLLAEAKSSGRNCTCVGEADGPRVVAPSNANVSAREVIVSE